MKPLSLLFCGVVAALLLLLVRTAGHIDVSRRPPAGVPDHQRIQASVTRVNEWLQQEWTQNEIVPADPADELTVLRRMSLALHGTIPSLEEVRTFTRDASADRTERWLLKMLKDSRFADYFSERLTRMLAGNDEGAFLVYRRDRLRDWLAEQIRRDRPWSETVTRLIGGDGLWTQDGHTNFITAAVIDDEGIDENILAGRTARAFLGQRIDCAQCHDHFFADWKQTDFEGLAAFFGQARVTAGGVTDRRKEDGHPVEYEITDPGSEETRQVSPVVPFHPEWQPEHGSRRRQLAAWVTHADNRRFRRAIANRIWGLMFGRAWREPVDDLPDPSDVPDLLDVLAAEMASHDDSLHALIRMIVLSDAFCLRSDVPESDSDTYTAMQQAGAVFPLVRLRPEQVIGSMVQAGNILTIDQNSHIFTRFARFTSENDFLKQYGEIPEDELLQQTGTIPQALLRMNGRFTRDRTRAELLSSAGQILDYSQDDATTVENCFLTCLTRLPTPEEHGEFVPRFSSVDAHRGQETVRQHAVEDLFWVLLNSPEFSWNH